MDSIKIYASQEWVGENTISLNSQTLTEEQKMQARTNIGAVSMDEMDESILPTSTSAFMAMPGTLKWNGDINGKEYIVIGESESERVMLVHVSDEIPSNLDVGLANISISGLNNEEMSSAGFPVAIESNEAGNVYMTTGDFSELVWIVTEDNNDIGIALKKGVYFLAFQSPLTENTWFNAYYASALWIPGYTFKEQDVVSWNDLEDKPFEEVSVHCGDTVANGDTLSGTYTNCDTRVAVNTYGRLVLVSNEVITTDDLQNGMEISVTLNDGSSSSYTISADKFVQSGNVIYDGDDIQVAIALQDGAELISDTLSLTFPKAGIYFIYVNFEGSYVTSFSITIPGHIFGTSAVKQLEDKFVPGYDSYEKTPATTTNELTWDGEIGDREYVFVSPTTDVTLTIVKVSDDPIDKSVFDSEWSYDQVTNGTTTSSTGSGIESEGEGYYALCDLVYVVTADTADLSGVVLTRGVHFILYTLDDGSCVYLSRLTVGAEVFNIPAEIGYRIKEDYLPDTVARISDISNVVKYAEQSLTEEQKAQARVNIDASNVKSWSDLEDKPFKTDIVTSVVISERIVDSVESTGRVLSSTGEGQWSSTVDIHDLFSVYVNGQQFVVTKEVRTDTLVWLGNTSFAVLEGGEDNGLPFFITIWPNSDGSCQVTFQTSIFNQDVTFSVSTYQEVVTPLDEKYLPESVESVIIRSSTEGSSKKFKLTIDDDGVITATEVV